MMLKATHGIHSVFQCEVQCIEYSTACLTRTVILVDDGICFAPLDWPTMMLLQHDMRAAQRKHVRCMV